MFGLFKEDLKNELEFSRVVVEGDFKYIISLLSQTLH